MMRQSYTASTHQLLAVFNDVAYIKQHCVTFAGAQSVQIIYRKAGGVGGVVAVAVSPNVP